MKVLGITAMIFAIVAIFVPLIGPYLTVICAFLAAFSFGAGITFGGVAIGVNILNVIFLSPSLWVMAGAAQTDKAGSGSDLLLGVGVILIGVQIFAAIILVVTHMFWKKKQATNTASA